MGVWPTADIENVYFKWFTLPVLVTLILIAFATLDLFLSLRVMSQQGLKLSTTGEYKMCNIIVAEYKMNQQKFVLCFSLYYINIITINAPLTLPLPLPLTLKFFLLNFFSLSTYFFVFIIIIVP